MTESVSVRGKVVLIVDDAIAIRKQVKAILEKEGCVVREAGSEIGMFNALEEYGRKADLVLMDLNLNTANGFDLIGRMRAVELYREIPVMILTEYADRENVAIARLASVKGYLVKPIEPALLVTRCQQAMAHGA